MNEKFDDTPLIDGQTLRLHMGELTSEEVLVAQSAYRLGVFKSPDRQDAEMWRKHKHTFEQVMRVINEARPLVHLMLNVEDAAKDARKTG